MENTPQTLSPTSPKMSKDINNWSEVFSDWKASGLSQARYCENNNIHFNSFTHQWSRHRKHFVNFTRVVTRDTTGILSEHNTISIKLPSGAAIELADNVESIKLVLRALGDIQ